VLGVGNVMMCDDGAGVRAIELLEAGHALPENVSVLSRGCLGMALLSEIREFDAIVLVDAIDGSGQPPGTVMTFSPEDIATYSRVRCAHDMRMSDVLEAAMLLGYEVDCVCVGVQVARIAFGCPDGELSPEVESAMPLLIETIRATLQEVGAQ
jgi:hydrogenase maturation protease